LQKCQSIIGAANCCGVVSKGLTVVPNDQISVAGPHLILNITFGLLNIGAPIACLSSPIFRLSSGLSR
jgi:hypothetical protein